MTAEALLSLFILRTYPRAKPEQIRDTFFRCGLVGIKVLCLHTGYSVDLCFTRPVIDVLHVFLETRDNHARLKKRSICQLLLLRAQRKYWALARGFNLVIETIILGSVCDHFLDF